MFLTQEKTCFLIIEMPKERNALMHYSSSVESIISPLSRFSWDRTKNQVYINLEAIVNWFENQVLEVVVQLKGWKRFVKMQILRGSLCNKSFIEFRT